MKVIEKKFPVPNVYIEPLGDAWAVYKESTDLSQGYMRTQEDVFRTLEEARAHVQKIREGKL